MIIIIMFNNIDHFLPNLYNYNSDKIYDIIQNNNVINKPVVGKLYLWAPGIGQTMRIVRILDVDSSPYGNVNVEYKNNVLVNQTIFANCQKFYELPTFFSNIEIKNQIMNINERNIPVTNGVIPGDFSFLPDSFTKRSLEDAWDAVTKLNLWLFFKNQIPPVNKGYMFWDAPELNQLHPILNVSHTNASFGCTLKIIQNIAINGWDKWVDNERKSKGLIF